MPTDISLDRNMIYILHDGGIESSINGTVSVIDGKNNTKIKDIEVGNRPSAIGLNPATATIYVANYGDDTVSVIDIWNHTKIANHIEVGKGPTSIAINPYSATIYVANYGDDTVSVIDGNANKVVAGIMFHINPFNAGNIECNKDKLIAPLEKQFYIWSGSKCIAKPNQGFEFVSWQENLNGNSTQPINISKSNPWDPILDIFGIKPDPSEATLNITKFGSFTANFKALPPPVPTEYIATLFSVVVTAFVGTWLTPTIIAWRKSKNQGRKLEYYHNQINSLNDDDILDKEDIDKLDDLRNNVTNEYTAGKITKEQYDKLVDETSINYNEIFKNELDSLNKKPENDKETKLDNIYKDVKDIHDKAKINNEQFIDLKKEISISYAEVYRKKIDLLKGFKKEDKEKQLQSIKDEIDVAYSKEKINELSYNLLQKNLLKIDI